LGGQTDITKLIVAFQNFENEPRNCRDLVGVMKYREVGST
jgi:hypothetical protein